MKRILLTLALMMPLQPIQAVYAQMPPPPHPMQPVRTISVTGEAHEEYAPDQAVLNVSVVSRNRDLNEAKQHNDKLTEKVVAITREFEIPKKDVATSNLYISPEYNYNNDKQQMIGYMVNRSLLITMDKMDIHEQLLSKIVNAGVDQVGGVEFRLANPEALSQKLREKAVESARARADVLAKAAGVKLGKPISISTPDAPQMPMPMMMKGAPMRMEAAADSGGSVAPSLPGMISLQESISVVYEIE